MPVIQEKWHTKEILDQTWSRVEVSTLANPTESGWGSYIELKKLILEAFKNGEHASSFERDLWRLCCNIICLRRYFLNWKMEFVQYPGFHLFVEELMLLLVLLSCNQLIFKCLVHLWISGSMVDSHASLAHVLQMCKNVTSVCRCLSNGGVFRFL